MPQTRVSVIIITYNEEHTVPRLLRALAQQTYEDFETIVVDSNSTDATERVARKAGRKLKQFRFHRMRERGIALGRNTGARLAQGEYLVFMDADILVGQDFLKRCVAAMDERGYGVGGIYTRADSTHPVDRFYYALLSAWFWAVQRVYPHAIGACMVARRDVHEAIGGFDSSIKLGEDNEYILRASKQFRVGMLPLTISISARRFATEGRLRMGLKYLGALFHRVFIGEIRNDTFRYKFGHYK